MLYRFIFPAIFVFSCMGCKKLTQVGEPVNTITTQETFGSNATANSAIVGIYRDFSNNNYGNGNTTFNLGMAADELHMFYGGPSPYETNTLSPAGDVSNFWANAYYDIYLANAAIEALPASAAVAPSAKTQLSGEAKFFRALCHFYLANLFGDVPIVMTTAYRISDTAHRMSTDAVYAQIISDLNDARNSLASDYSISNGEKIRVNKWGAAALLARVYLFKANWEDAEAQASAVIDSAGLYSLETDPNNVFLANSKEAILQLQTANTFPYTTIEGALFIPYDSTSNPSYYISDQLLGAFEPGDLRRTAWVDSTDFSGAFYYYPFKYKIRNGAQGNILEYYMVLRLAEQFLIRAEARAHLSNLDGAIADLNSIRERAGLTDLPPSLTQTEVFAAVAQERRIELFSELGHRWLDLKRIDSADAVLGAIKSTWKPTAKLFPIPASELINDANLTQNPGY